jgi:hypothetical protein
VDAGTLHCKEREGEREGERETQFSAGPVMSDIGSDEREREGEERRGEERRKRREG